MLALFAVLAGLGWLSSRYQGCAESRVGAPAPACDLGKAPITPRRVVADLVRADPKWLLARDDDEGALVMSTSTSVFVFPATERREPTNALAAFIHGLAPEVRAALRRTSLLLVWL